MGPYINLRLMLCGVLALPGEPEMLEPRVLVINPCYVICVAVLGLCLSKLELVVIFRPKELEVPQRSPSPFLRRQTTYSYGFFFLFEVFRGDLTVLKGDLTLHLIFLVENSLDS